MVKNSLFNFLGSFLNLTIALISIPILIRNIGLDHYGAWAFVTSLLAFVAIAEAGLSTTGIVYFSDLNSKPARAGCDEELSAILTAVFGFLVLAASIFSAIYFFLLPKIVAGLVALGEVNSSHVLAAIRIGSLHVFFKIITQGLVSIQKGYKRFGIYNALNTTYTLLLNSGFVFLSFFSKNLSVYSAWWAVLTFVFFLFHLFQCKRILKGREIRFLYNKEKLREIVGFSSYVWGSNVFQTLFTQVDRVIVGVILGVDKLGIYSACTSVVRNINILSASVVQPLLPEVTITSYSDESNKEKLVNLVKVASLALSSIICLMSLGLFFLANDVLNLIFGEYPDKKMVCAFILLVFVYTLYSFNAVGYFLNLSMKNSSHIFNVTAVSVVVFILLLLFATKYFGVYGAFLASIAYVYTLKLLMSGLNLVGIELRVYLSWNLVPLLLISAALSIALIVNIIGVQSSIRYVFFSVFCLLFGVWVFSNWKTVRNLCGGAVS